MSQTSSKWWTWKSVEQLITLREEREKEEERGDKREEERKIGDRIIQHETIIRHVILLLKTRGTFQRRASLCQENTVIYGRLRIKFGAQI